MVGTAPADLGCRRQPHSALDGPHDRVPRNRDRRRVGDHVHRCRLLHIDRDEQLRRLDHRRNRPDLIDLHNPEGYRDQEQWEELMEAY
jgi:hypothetical protein